MEFNYTKKKIILVETNVIKYLLFTNATDKEIENKGIFDSIFFFFYKYEYIVKMFRETKDLFLKKPWSQSV